MPDERHIEKTLRAYAKRRRDEAGTPPGLHPAARQLLQAEVARLNRETRPAPGFASSWWWLFSPRFALGIAAAAVLLLVVISLPRLRPSPSRSGVAQQQLAKNTPAAMPADKSAAPPTAPPPAALEIPSNPNLAQSARNQVTDAAQARAPAPASAPPPPPPAAATLPLSSQETSIAAPPAASPALAAAEASRPVLAPPPQPVGSPAGPVTPAPAPASAFFRAADLAAAPALTRHFDRLNRLPVSASLDDSSRRDLLSSFRVEQDGDQLRVIDDSDGSVYSGSLTNAAAPTQSASLASGSAPNAAATNVVLDRLQTIPAPVPNYTFSVRGTNLTLNQLVVMTGSVAPFGRAGTSGGGFGRRGAASNAPLTITGGGGGGGFGGGGGGRGGAAFGGRGGQAAAFQLSGTVFVGTNQFSIIARPSAP
jgi:hypothetical protein